LKSFFLKQLLLLSILVLPLSAGEPPSLKKGIAYLSKFISTEYFASLKKTSSDLALVDTLYLRAAKFYEGDTSEALLALTFACLPYKEVNIRIPLISVTLQVPLPAVQDPLFSKKTKNLPSRLLPDSPEGEFGDKDKLSHFFGNAFIEYNFPVFNISKFLGIFVEKFEETFYVQGAMDLRDMLVNRMGARFGKELRTVKTLLPSRFFNKNMIKK